MKINNMTKNEFEKLKRLPLHPGIINAEATLYLSKKSNKELLIKVFNSSDTFYMANKLYTINMLAEYKQFENIPELIMPIDFISVKNEIKGFTQKYIPSIGLAQYLQSYNINVEEKIEAFKQINMTLNKIDKLNKSTKLKNFCLNDIHEDNFIVDKNGKLHVVDLDAAKIGTNRPVYAKYLSYDNKLLTNIHGKYKVKEEIIGNICMPNRQTDIYCFYMMLLNSIYGERLVHTMDEETFYDYINYLYRIGMSKDLYEIIINLYTAKPNELPEDLIENIAKLYYKGNKNIYHYERSKRKIFLKDS